MMMRRLIGASLGLGLTGLLLAGVLLTGAAQAFQQTGEQAAQPKSDPAQPGAKAKPLDLSGSGSVPTEKGGTAVRIPGLGTLGVLPKLDFGLELLYGDGQAQQAKPRDEAADDDGLQIKGTLKHRF